ncbi:MAG: hypothetical protein ABSE73_16310 [Planctomycetota bacterium]
MKTLRGPPGAKTALAVLFVGALAAQHLSAAESSEQPVVIGPRRASTPSGASTREWFRSGISDAAYQEEAASAAVLLGGDKLSAEEKAVLGKALCRDREHSGRAFGACLDWRHYDATTRLGAARAIGMAAPAPQTTARALANTVLAEPVPEVRKEALDLVRGRKDAAVTAELLRFWRAAYDSDLGFDEAKRAAAVAALRDVGDRRAYEALFYLVTLEVRAGVASGPAMSEVAIQGQGVKLPIQLPGMDLKQFEGTVMVPALASLKGATGQDFGRDLAKWRDWLSKQPDFKR